MAVINALALLNLARGRLNLDFKEPMINSAIFQFNHGTPYLRPFPSATPL